MKRLLLILAFLFIFHRGCYATVAFDTTTGNKVSNGSSYTFTLTTNATNEVAVVGIVVSGSATVSSITGGSSVTWSQKYAHTLPVTSYGFEIWQGLCPGTQSATITINLSTNAYSTAVCDTYSGANTTTPLEGSHFLDFTASTTNPLSDNVTTVTANALVISFAGNGVLSAAVDSLTAGTGYTITTTQQITNGTTIGVGTIGERGNAVTASPASTAYSWVNPGTFTGSIVGISIAPPASTANHNGLLLTGVG